MPVLLLIVAGLFLLVVGAEFLVRSAGALAAALGLSPLVIGLTVVAFGTSAPELAMSLASTVRGTSEIAVGNVVGSNTFNILGVLGISALAAGTGLPISDATLSFDLVFMSIVAVACLPVFVTGAVVSRWEGALFLGLYVAYTTLVVLGATGVVTLSPIVTVALCSPPIAVTVVAVARGRRRRER